MENKKLITILILVITIILASIALFVALNLYKMGKEETKASPIPSLSPTPSQLQTPEVFQEEAPGPCELFFEIQISTSPSPSLSPSPTPSISPSPSPSLSPSPTPSIFPSPSPSPLPECWEKCTSSDQCPDNLVCQNVSGTYRCVNSSCPTESDCVCAASPQPISSPTYVASQSPQPSIVATQQLPISSPTYVASQSPQPSIVATQQLPEAGIISPTLIFGLGGLLLLAIGILL